MRPDKISMDEVARHSTPDDCWVVLCGKVYNLTDFHAGHPGGAAIILNLAGMDATNQFLHFHPRDFADRMLSPDCCIGFVDEATIQPHHVASPIEDHDDATDSSEARATKPPLAAILNAFDFESVAATVMDKKGWAYYSSGADDEITLRENHLAFQRVWIKPRVLVDVENVDTTRRFLGATCSLPLYFTATAMARLADEQGEVAIVKAAYKCGVPYMLPTLSSCTLDEMLAAKQPDQANNRPPFCASLACVYLLPDFRLTYVFVLIP